MFLFELVDLRRGFNAYFRIVPAITPELADQAYRLRRAVHDEEATLQSARPEGRDPDEFDARAICCLVESRKTGEYVGCARVILPSSQNSENPFPIEKSHAEFIERDVFDPRRIARSELGEISRLAIVSAYRRRRGEKRNSAPIEEDAYGTAQQPRFPYVPFVLYFGCIAIARRRKIKHILVLLEPRTARHFAQLGICIRRIDKSAEGSEEHGRRVPCVIDASSFPDDVVLALRPLYRLIEEEVELAAAQRESVCRNEMSGAIDSPDAVRGAEKPKTSANLSAPAGGAADPERPKVALRLENVCTADFTCRTAALKISVIDRVRALLPRAHAEFATPPPASLPLKDISFTVEKGMFVVIAGRPDGGRSALLRLIGCRDRASSGHIVIDDVCISDLDRKQFDNYRVCNVGWVSNWTALQPNRSAKWHVQLALSTLPDISVVEANERVAYLLNMVGLAEQASEPVGGLMRGARARTALAAAMAIRPRLLIWDDPTYALDQGSGEGILSTLSALNQVFEITTILGTSDQRLIAIADRLIRIEDGEITQLGIRSGSNWSLTRTKQTVDPVHDAEIRALFSDPDFLDDPALQEIIMEDPSLRRALLRNSDSN
jgi:N-acyl amino acid synthase of PEP-CTERM/exosortase system